MDAPGVTVRPIRQMTGGSSFNEVYLDGVELSDDLRLGPVGQGWKVALTVLAAERLDSGNLGLANADRAVELARHLGRPLTELERDRVADLVTRSYVQRLTGHAGGRGRGRRATTPVPRPRWASSSPPTPWPGRPRSCGCCSDRELAADAGGWGTWAWTEHLLGAPGYRIAGGTDEIQHNIIAERVLGLPREPRA